MAKYVFNIPIQPRPWQSTRFKFSKKTDRTWSYKPKWVKYYEKSIATYIKSTGYKRKLTGDLRVVKLEYTFAVKDKRLWGKRKPTRPDLMDNLQKLPIDVLTKVGLIEDDSHIVECLLLRKKYGEKGNIELHIEEISK